MPRFSISVKKHVAGERLLISLCDSELLGKKFSEKRLQLDLGSAFYKGEEMEEEKISVLLSGASIVNAVGTRSLALLRQMGYEMDAIKVKGIPHTQLILI
ncbi:MAG: DUF424 family protein [Nanoarchaeota archaeon]|nr:DUF424 family protein [Nanoarchaeota archaeon]